MDTIEMVEPLIDDSRQFLDRLLDDGVAVRAAALMKLSDEDRWTLHIATPLYEDLGASKAYGRIFDVYGRSELPGLTDNELRLVGANSAFAREVPELLKRYPGRNPLYSRLWRIGDIPVDGAYLFPLVRPHTELSDEQKQILIECYFSRDASSVDDLPYTADMDRIHRDFVDRTGIPLSVRDVFKALKNLGRQGRLSGKSRQEQAMATAAN
jgi:hypothetical protein